MMRRIIRGRAAQMGDERLTEITDLVASRMEASLAIDGEQPLDLHLLMDAARTAGEIKDPGKREAVMRYISALHEPQRTILLKRKAGWTAREIAVDVGMEVKPVCKVLAQMYADLKGILS